MHLARWLVFAALFALAYLVSPAPATPASPAEIIAPKLLSILSMQDRARQRLLVLSATKEAIMRDNELRGRVRQSISLTSRTQYADFWQHREADDSRARSDPEVEAVRNRLELQPKGKSYEQLQLWLDEAAGLTRRSPRPQH